MRINVYSQELTSEVINVRKESNTGVVYEGAQLVLHSSPRLHHQPEDDDRSAVTFWLPKSPTRREEMARAFDAIALIFRGTAPAEALPTPEQLFRLSNVVQAVVTDYLSEYEYRGDEGTYTPEPQEVELIADAIAGLLAERAFIAALVTAQDVARRMEPVSGHEDAWLLGLQAGRAGQKEGDNPFSAWNRVAGKAPAPT